MFNIYVDNWVNIKKFETHQKKWLIKLCVAQLENRIKWINQLHPASNLLWWEANFTWSEVVWTWSDFASSDKFILVEEIIGKSERADIQHIDTAYMIGVKFFVTNNPNDFIINWKREKLEELYKFKIVNWKSKDEKDNLLNYLESL